MKEIFMSWQDQLDFMENHAGATGETCYEALREMVSDGVRWEHGKYASINYEEIPKEELEAFLAWLEEPEE